ncbi:MAG: hypothetical protein ACRD4S_14395 [Candidatus Acidiferrales bacterium]
MHRWKSSLSTALLLVVFGQCLQAGAQKPSGDEIPQYILSGAEAYKADGPEAAIKAWLKDSPLDGSKEALAQANVLRQIQDFYGAYKDFDVIRSQNISPKIQTIYLTLNYEKGPLFGKFVSYRTDHGWVLTNFAFNTKPENILPGCQ